MLLNMESDVKCWLHVDHNDECRIYNSYPIYKDENGDHYTHTYVGEKCVLDRGVVIPRVCLAIWLQDRTHDDPVVPLTDSIF